MNFINNNENKKRKFNLSSSSIKILIDCIKVFIIYYMISYINLNEFFEIINQNFQNGRSERNFYG